MPRRASSRKSIQGHLVTESSDSGKTQAAQEQRAAISEPVRSMSVWARIKEHKVVQWTIAYAAAAYTLLHGTEMVSNAFEWPHVVVRIVTLLLFLGVPLVATIAWYHGHRAQRRVSGAELTIITVLLVIAGTVLWQFGRSAQEHAARKVGTTAPTSATAAAIAADHSIAVLPFVNMSPDKDQEYFADGISEELMNLLVQVPDLRVIARTSSFSFKGKEVEIAEIAHRLDVAHVLEGSVRRSGDKVRISAQLIRASDSSRLWSQTYERQMTDVFDVQDQIAAAVVSELKMRLLGATPKAKITDPKAYTLFLQARQIGYQYTSAGFELSNKLYQQALGLDPGYAAAWAGLATNYWNQAFSGLAPIDQSIRLAREATNKALALEPTLASALVRLSLIASSYDVDLSMGAHHLRDALASEPANPDVLVEAGALVRRLGRLDEAIAIGKYQVGLDPINPFGHEILAYSYRYAGRLDDAIAELRTVLSLSPNYLGVHEGIGELLLQKGDAKWLITCSVKSSSLMLRSQR
jgi:TolB-like protein